MKSIIGLIIIGVAVIFGSRFIERPGAVSNFFKRFFAGGLAYLLLGVLLGPSGLAILDDRIIEKLSPVTTIALYWIGFLFGINLNWRDLKKVQPSVHILALGQSSFTFVMVALTFYFILTHRFQFAINQDVLAAALVALAACASGTNQSTLLRLLRDRRFRGPTARIAAVTATLDDLPAIVICGVLTFVAVIPGEAALAPLFKPAAAFVLGIGGAAVMRMLLKRVESDQVRLLIVLGCMAFSGGLSAFFRLSPIFIGALAGAVFANMGSRDERVFDIVHRTESTMYVLFLLLVGSMLYVNDLSLLWLGATYFLIRAAAKIIGNYLFLIPLRRNNSTPPKRLLGLSLLSQGGMALALAVHYRSLYRSPFADSIVAVIVFGVFISELFAYPLALRIAGKEQ
jgi:Kef-type K+ transport system membrane component KefB